MGDMKTRPKWEREGRSIVEVAKQYRERLADTQPRVALRNSKRKSEKKQNKGGCVPRRRERRKPTQYVREDQPYTALQKRRSLGREMSRIMLKYERIRSRNKKGKREDGTKGHYYRRVFSHNFDIFFAHFFNLPYFPVFFPNL